MLRVSDNHFGNLHSLMALNYRCVGDFRSQGDGPRPKITIIKTNFCYIAAHPFSSSFYELDSAAIPPTSAPANST